MTQRFSSAAEKYAGTFMEQLESAAACDPGAKKEKVREFAEMLVEKGGPAVNQVTKLFGKETAERLILGHMYGVR